MTDDLFFDTDCLSSFLWIHHTNLLQSLYGGRIILPDPVYAELSNPSIPHIKRKVDAMLSDQSASIKSIELDTDEYKLYHELITVRHGQKTIGRGEAAGIALAKTYNGILASNNYRDISFYIEKYHLKHIDTGHILLEALEKEMLTEAEGNVIWQKMLQKNRKLPADSFSEYILHTS